MYTDQTMVTMIPPKCLTMDAVLEFGVSYLYKLCLEVGVSDNVYHF